MFLGNHWRKVSGEELDDMNLRIVYSRWDRNGGPRQPPVGPSMTMALVPVCFTSLDGFVGPYEILCFGGSLFLARHWTIG